MAKATKRQSGVQERFIKLVALMRGDGRDEALAAYRTLMSWNSEDKEELIFRIQQKFAAEKRRFIDLNNRLVGEKFRERVPKRTLLLVPFCVQQRTCPHHIAWNVLNCKNCGKCPVGALRDIARRYGMTMRVAVRSAFAPAIVREVRPELVVAVACEDELLAGLLRIAPRDCYGILNARPDGECRNTRVDIQVLEAEAARLLNHGRKRPRG